MKTKIAGNAKSLLYSSKVLKHAMFSTEPFASFHQYLPAAQVLKLLFMMLLCCSACGNKEQPGNEQATEQPDIKFDKTKWNTMNDGNYRYRKQMVNDLLDNYQWAGVKKDSVVQMLGQPDGIEEGNLMYNYEKKPFLGGFGTTIEAIVFELTPDSTVKIARFNDGGWD